ncbi:MAG: hypothetical protein AMXMBFR77_28090 [Phycisphaerales bacterium]
MAEKPQKPPSKGGRPRKPKVSPAAKERELMLAQLTRQLSAQDRSLFDRGRHLEAKDLLGLALVRIRELVGQPVVETHVTVDDRGKEFREVAVNTRLLSQLLKALKIAGDLVTILRDESDLRPAALEILWGDFRDLPEDAPDVPLRIDDLFGGELRAKRRNWRGNLEERSG